MLPDKYEDGIPTDPIAGIQTRHSMQLRRSSENYHHHRLSLERGDRERLIHNYDSEANGSISLADVAEDSDEDTDRKHTSFTSGPNDRPRTSATLNRELARPSRVVDRTSAIR